MTLFGLPSRAALFWLVVTSAAAAVLLAGWTTTSIDASTARVAIAFAVACGVAERIRVRLGSSRPGGGVVYSLASTVLIAVILLFPIGWAVMIAAAGSAFGLALRHHRHPEKLVFNVAGYTLSVAAGSAVWALGGHLDLASPWAVPLIAVTALAYFTVNTSLIAAMVGLVVDLPVRLVWRRGHRNVLLAHAAMLAAGVPVAAMWVSYPWLLVCLAVVLLGVHHALADRVQLESQTLESLFQLADILDARDAYTHGHSERVGHYAEQVAIQLGMPSDRAHLTFLAGRLHDIGKCAINNEVLLKRGALDDGERDHMRRHPEVGSAMLSHFSLFHEVATFVRGHHERWDGQGYPDGLTGEEIPLEARIIAVVDSYDAMTTTRPYRVALPHEEAVRRLEKGSGRQWDPRVVTTFIQWSEDHQTRAPIAALQRQPVAS